METKKEPDPSPEREIPWTDEALRRVENAPDFVRPGIYKLMAKRARERGKTVIDSEFLTEIRNESMMLVSKRIKHLGFEDLSIAAFDKAKEKFRSPQKKKVIDEIKTFLAERTEKNESILEKFARYMDDPSPKIGWEPEALERLNRAPSFVRDMAKRTIEDYAKKNGYRMVTLECLNQVFTNLIPDAAKRAMGIGPNLKKNP
jgi:hypothetical protein